MLFPEYHNRCRYTAPVSLRKWVISKSFCLNEANESLEQLGASFGTQELETGKDFNMEPILSTMIEDLEYRWEVDMDINKYSCHLVTNRGKPCGYTKEQILSFTLDDSGGLGDARLLCRCNTPCSDVNSYN
jgi:hypothetical protein